MLSGLELTFMSLTRCKSSLFCTPVFIFSLWENEKGGEGKKRRRVGGKKEIEKERKEGRRNKVISEAR